MFFTDPMISACLSHNSPSKPIKAYPLHWLFILLSVCFPRCAETSRRRKEDKQMVGSITRRDWWTPAGDNANESNEQTNTFSIIRNLQINLTITNEYLLFCFPSSNYPSYSRESIHCCTCLNDQTNILSIFNIQFSWHSQASNSIDWYRENSFIFHEKFFFISPLH